MKNNPLKMVLDILNPQDVRSRRYKPRIPFGLTLVLMLSYISYAWSSSSIGTGGRDSTPSSSMDQISIDYIDRQRYPTVKYEKIIKVTAMIDEAPQDT